MKKLEKFYAAYFRGKNYFGGDGTQNYLVFQVVYNYFNTAGFEIVSWKSKGLLNKKINSVMSSNGAAPKIVYDTARIKVKFDGILFKTR